MSSLGRRTLRSWLRDMAFGAVMFLMLPLVSMSLQTSDPSWTFSEAIAGEVIATRAFDLTSPAGADTENAVVAAAQLRPAVPPLHSRRLTEMLILGLTFSLIVAFNMALWRHLRRVNVRRRGQTWARRQ